MSNTIARTLAGTAIAATMAGAAFAGTAAAHASSDGFINQLNSHGWYEYTPGYLVSLGYSTCGVLEWRGWDSAVNNVYLHTDAGTTWNKSAEFVALAHGYLC